MKNQHLWQEDPLKELSSKRLSQCLPGKEIRGTRNPVQTEVVTMKTQHGRYS